MWGENSCAAWMPVFEMKITEIFSVLFPTLKKVQGQKPIGLKKTDSALLRRPDEVKLAEDAKFIASLRAEMGKSNASRDEKLAGIQRRLDEGNYEIKTDDLVNKILGE